MSALEIHHLSKTFAGQVVLHDVGLTVAEGEVHSLVGQNGSGKSTLIKVLAGYHEPDAGASATVHGEPLELGSSSDAHRLNVRFVHQDLGLVNDLSITENIMLGRRYPRRRGGAIDWKAARVAARDLITRAGSSLDVRRTIGELGIADRTRVAIARALPENDDPSIIVLDEPTAALPARDVEQLFGTIRHLTQAGNAVVLVSHHLDEILGISDSITVLRDGVRVATVGVREVNHDSLVHLIIGKELVKGSGRAEAIAHRGSPTLTVGELSADSVLDVSAALHPGEIVGVAGLAGSGRELLAGLITGRLSRRGVVTVAGAQRACGAAEGRARGGHGVDLGRTGPVRHVQQLERAIQPHHGRSAATHPRRPGQRPIRAQPKSTTGSTGWASSHAVPTSRSPACPAATNRRCSSPAHYVSRRVCSCSTIRPLVSTSALANRCTPSSSKHTTDSMSVLLVSTDSDELARLCDRVLVMVRGVVATELHRGTDLTAENIDHAQVAGAAA